MKLKIMIMTLLLVSVGIGIGSAINRLPATEFVGDVNLGGYDIIDAKMGQSMPWTTVGAYSWCDYVTDGVADQIEINQAIANSFWVVLYGDFNTTESIEFINLSDTRYSDGSRGPRLSGINARINSTADVGIFVNCTDNIYIENIHLYRSDISPGSVGIETGFNNEGTVSIFDSVWVHGFDTQLKFGNDTAPGGRSPEGMNIVQNSVIGKYEEIGRSVSIYGPFVLGLKIVNNRITGYEEYGIHLGRSDSVTIRDNIIISVGESYGGNLSKTGIYINPNAYVKLSTDIHITGNSIENCEEYVIKVDASSAPVFCVWITDNHINGYNHGIEVIAASRVSIRGNTFGEWRHGTSGRPIIVHQGSGGLTEITGNKIYQRNSPSYGYAIYLHDATGGLGSTVSNNQIFRGTYSVPEGIVINGADNTTVIGNSFSGTGAATSLIHVKTGTKNCVVVGNSGTSAGAKIVDDGTNSVISANG